MVNREFTIITTIAAIMISSPVIFGLIVQAQGPGSGGCSSVEQQMKLAREKVSNTPDGGLAVSGPNIYTAWTCYNHVLFAKSNDGGKTFANTMLMSTSATNPKQYVMNDNVSIGASGNTVAIMWDSNKTGIVNPVIRTSSDGGNTFSNIVTLNSTSGGINK